MESEGDDDERRGEAEERLSVAVSNVKKADIQEIKAFANPPAGVKDVFAAVHLI